VYPSTGCGVDGSAAVFPSWEGRRRLSTELHRIAWDARAEALDDERVRLVVSAWRPCMAAAGYEVWGPDDARFLIDEEGNAVGDADSSCNHEVGLASIWAAVEGELLANREQSLEPELLDLIDEIIEGVWSVAGTPS
jgi:hypothetical protein